MTFDKEKILNETLRSIYGVPASSVSVREQTEHAWGLLQERINNDIEEVQVPGKRPGFGVGTFVFESIESFRAILFSQKKLATITSCALLTLLFFNLRSQTEAGGDLPGSVNLSDAPSSSESGLIAATPYHLDNNNFRIEFSAPRIRYSSSQPSFNFVSSGVPFGVIDQMSPYSNNSQLISEEGLHAFRESSDFNNHYSRDILEYDQRDVFADSSKSSEFVNSSVDSTYLRFTTNE